MTPNADTNRIHVESLDVAYGNAPVLHQSRPPSPSGR